MRLSITRIFLHLFIVSISITLLGCTRRENTSHNPPPQLSPKTTNPPPPPKIAEVQETVTRIYKNALVIVENHNPSFIIGDFDADRSQDLAVVVMPAKGMLKEINSEFANWILGDPQKIVLPDPNLRIQYTPTIPKPVRVEKADVLLAVIHGYDSSGWRNPAAKQTYLLKNAVGDNMRSESVKDLLSSMKGKAKLPQLNGDGIRVTLDGKPGFIYWTGAKYAWYH